LTGLAGQTNGVLAYGQFTTTTFSAGSYSVGEYALPFTGNQVNFQ
jgi:hypothetical protein